MTIHSRLTQQQKDGDSKVTQSTFDIDFSMTRQNRKYKS